MYTWIHPARLAAVVVVLLTGGLVTAAPADAQTAETRYERALAREHAARQSDAPTLATLRSIAVAYEQIVRRYPRSGYSDNALWQGAGVLQLAWDRAGQTRDRTQALKLLEWLRTEYPSSSLIRQISVRSEALKAPRAVAERAAAPAPPRDDPAPSRTEPAATPKPFPVAASNAGSRSGSADARDIVVKGLSHTPLPRGDRLTLELSAETTYMAGTTSTPGELVLTVADAEAAAAIVGAASSIRGTLIQGVRLQNTAGGLQVAVAVDAAARHSAFPLYGPDRLVFDFEAAARDGVLPPSIADSAAALGAPAVREPSAPVPAAPAAASSSIPAAVPVVADVSSETGEFAPSPAPPASIHGEYSLARQLGLGVSRIVIDPGHGGSDPGASANGVTESALVLDVALRLEKLLLAQPGFEVVLTRRTNAAVPLAQRTAIANAEAADLFLSIHANSSPRRETAGVETYVLNLSTNPQAEAVAARENASSAEVMRTLPQLIRTITTNNKLTESRELARMVQSSLVRGLQPRNRQFKDLGVKQAPFMVLIGAQMPSVLAEIAFLTNRAEAGLLKQNDYKQKIAQALCDAILQYRASLKQVTTVAASTAGR